ncbi:MAG: hypothetical protein KIS96_06420 [Bauldia sp.]|nr:hypothetical protein [Bauldia sp.]
MRFSRTLASALALSLAAPAALAHDADPRFAAFVEACFGAGARPSVAAVIETALGLGWVEVERSADPELESLMQRGDEAMAEAPDEDDVAIESFDNRLFAREIEGAPFYLVLTEVASAFGNLAGCYLYDFAADAAPDFAPMSEVLGGEPYQTADEAGTLTAAAWALPSAFPGVLEVGATFIPAGSAFAAETGFDGVSFLARWSPATP